MATLQAGQTVSIQLAEGESYTVTPSGTAQVSTRGVSGSELSAPRTLTSAQTFGPYTEAGVINIACLIGTAVYNQAANVVAQYPATGAGAGLFVGDSNTSFAFDQGPTVTAIADNGDGTATVTFNASHNWAVGQRITVNNSTVRALNVFDAEVTAQVNTNPYTVTFRLGGRTSPVVSGVAASTQTLYSLRYSPLGFLPWLEALQNRRMGAILAAAGGADSTQALTMFEDAQNAAMASHASDVVIMIGTNDVFARGWDFATAKASIQALVDAVSALPVRIWWLTPPPLNSANAAWTSGKQTVMNRLIRWMARYAPTIGATFVDTWRGAQNGSSFVNGGAANPDATANFLGADNTHTTNLGALAIARALNTAMREVQATRALGFQGAHAATQNQGNVLTNSRLTGTGGTKTPGSGTISGSAPDSWTVEITSGTGTITLTNPARTVANDGDTDGNNLQVIPSVSATTWRLLQSGLQAAVTAGEVRDLYIPVTITGAAALTGVELIIFGTKSAGGNENIGLAGTSQAITGDFSGTLRVPRWTVPSGLTALSVFLRFTGATAGTFVIGKPSFELVE